nr:calcineurin-binding protein cabin-1-like isoform X2 [Leptinotarsa decemlineata]
MDKLISILFAIKDTIACLVYIGKALMLDPDYTKGLVLRRQIYRDNPAAKEYYQLYNPDYTWEPPLDVTIDEEDEKAHLQEVQVLCDRVTEIEKSLGPKPLQTIPLSKPLTDYTWLSLANTVIDLHQYITDNDMSHFTFIDMNRCMSQTVEEHSCFKIPQHDAELEPATVDEKLSEEIPSESAEVVNGEEKMDTAEPQLGRRFSQTSETNIEGQENTPVQTDNDEEQNMDQDNEDPDDNNESKEKGKQRGSKRKRDPLSDLQTWSWYTKRKLSKKAKDKDFTVEGALERIIPKNLLPYRIDPEKFNNAEDSMDTMDLYNMYMENHDVNYLSPIHSPKSVNYEAYFGTDRERDDVQEFWTKKREYCDAIVLIKDLVFRLSKLWNYKWPKELIPLYIKAFGMFREHCDQPQVFCSDLPFEDLRNDALATILFGELSNFSSDDNGGIPPTAVGYLQLISGWEEDWKEEYPMFFNRVFWLRSHLFRKENSVDLAIRSLEVIQEMVAEEEAKYGERYMLSLPNCLKYGLITNEITQKILKHLDTIKSLATVEGLFSAEKYTQVADILKVTFNDSGVHPQVGRMGRPAQLGLLMHSLWFTDMSQCFVWTEECLNEAFDQYVKVSKDHDKWEKIIEKCLAILHEIIKQETVGVIDLLEEKKRGRLVETLAKIVSKQLNTEGVAKIPLDCVTPWILLHYILQREEHRQYASRRMTLVKRDKAEALCENLQVADKDLPPSIDILFSAHEFLGSKGWCLTNQGELLHFILDTVLDRIDTPIFERLRNKIDIHIEQAMFCLYQHPSKKNKISRHLADHNVDPLPLSWERSFQLFEFYGPDCLPEFNSYKSASISADLEQLFKRIIALVPPHCAPAQHLPKIMDFVHGKTDKFPEAIDFPNKVRSIYYLIGDFYFKQREFIKCIKYFQLDLCINPLRLDSWGCLGLSYASQLDTKLNHCEKFKSETEFLDKAKYASICFQKALEISPDQIMLWIECGTFQYTVHSYCSRVLKFESENLSMEKFEFLESQKNSYLDSSGNSFEKAISLYEMKESNEADERWLQYYILGKIAEKKQKEPAEYLQLYMTASTLLDENKAEYPDKIYYNNPQHLAVEALELHYRINASVLKYLELHEGKDIPNTLGTFFKKCLNSSKFSRKPKPSAQKPETESPIKTVEKVTPEPPVKTTESSASLSFQEQFLNSLSKLEESDKASPADKSEKKEDAEKNKNEEKVLPSETSEKGDIVPPREVELDSKVSSGNPGSTPSPNLCLKPEAEPVLKVDPPSNPSEKKVEVVEESKKDEDKTETLEIPDEDVIMISDSEEEEKKNEEESEKTEEEGSEKAKGQSNEMAMEVENEKAVEEILEKPEEIREKNMGEKNESVAADVSDNHDETLIVDEIKDMQQMFDEMMEKTMKETEEERNGMDSDMSGADRVEEVVVSKDEKEAEETKVVSKMEVDAKEENVGKPKKIKPSDSETDGDNARTSVDDSSSGSSSSSSSSDSSDSDSDDDDDDEEESSSSSSTSSSERSNEFMSDCDITHLIDRCVSGLEICVSRLSQNYKALYRLAHLYFNYKSKKDMIKCRQLLLGEYKCKDGTIVAGLFSDRKPTNFFNGILRIPSTEIDRPGSLSAHMSRCISLLMQILRTTTDNKTLIDLSIQLRKTPEPDKIYIKDSERMAFSEQAIMMCSQSLRSQMKNIGTMTNPQIAKILQEIFRVYQRLQKHIPVKESQFASMIVEVYKKFIKEKIPDNVNVLDLATKFCLQNRQAEKQKLQPTQKGALLMPRGSGMTNSPTLPSPSNITTPPALPLKRPGASRPRGRPPLPKTPGQPRQPRGKNLSSTMPKMYSWQKSLFDQSYTYEYLKHYQEELIKQYSQNLSVPQLTQLSQILTQGQLTNPVTAQAITSQFLAQSGLLNPSNLVKQMNSVRTVGQTQATQLMDSPSQLNPSAKKKTSVDQSLAGLTADQLKLLSSLMPTSSKQSALSNKITSPHTTTSPSGIISSKSKLKQSSTSSTKSVVTDPGKGKQSIATTAAKSVPGMQVFKEPTVTKTSNSAEEKAAKDLMKNRPSISITPVSVGLNPPPSISPVFMRPSPTTSPSGGKTLQEKLADKKKEQLNKEKLDQKMEQLKQMKSAVEKEKRPSEATIKNFNIPSLPSSLSLSQSSVPTTSVAKTSPVVLDSTAVPRTMSNGSSKYPSDLGLSSSIASQMKMDISLPPSIKVSKTTVPMPTPMFSADSGISISQVPANSTSKSKAKSISPKNVGTESTIKFSLTPSVDISPVKYKSENSSSVMAKTKHKEKRHLEKSPAAKSTKHPEKSHKESRHRDQTGSTRVEGTKTDQHLKRVDTSKSEETKHSSSSKSSRVDSLKPMSNKVIKTLKFPLENNNESAVTTMVKKPDPPQRKQSSDDDVICID